MINETEKLLEMGQQQFRRKEEALIAEVVHGLQKLSKTCH